MTATATTVEIDRQLLEDVYLEASGVCEAFERLAGACPTDFTEAATNRLERLLVVLTAADDDEREAWWDRTLVRAGELLAGNRA